MNWGLKKKISSLLIATLICSTITVCYQAKPIAYAKTSVQTTQEKNLEYLSTYFGITSFGNSVTSDEFTEALSKVGNMKESKTPQLVYGFDALKLSVIAADFEELATTYSSKKAASSIRSYNINVEVPSEYTNMVACALDTNLIDAASAQQLIKNQPVTDQQAMELVMSVANINGRTWNFLGYSSDRDIYSKLNKAWKSFGMLDNKKLSEIGKEAVENKVTTGYNIRYSGYDANFLPELTLRYGHSDIKHANQLIGLLNSEGIVAKVQLEPKTSVFEYMLDWGPIPEPTPYYEVKKINDKLYLAYAVEYDLMLEFENINDKRAFDSVIMQYSKKSDKNPKGVGMLYGAWWQPLYTSTEEMYGSSYNLIYDNVITDGEYTFHSFCLPESKKTVAEKLKAIDPSVKVEQPSLWCDAPFYRYLNGDYQ